MSLSLGFRCPSKLFVPLVAQLDPGPGLLKPCAATWSYAAREGKNRQIDNPGNWTFMNATRYSPWKLQCIELTNLRYYSFGIGNCSRKDWAILDWYIDTSFFGLGFVIQNSWVTRSWFVILESCILKYMSHAGRVVFGSLADFTTHSWLKVGSMGIQWFAAPYFAHCFLTNSAQNFWQ